MSGGLLVISSGRGGETRTHGLAVPNDARYQTAPHPDLTLNDTKLLYHNAALGTPSAACYRLPPPLMLTVARNYPDCIQIGALCIRQLARD